MSENPNVELCWHCNERPMFGAFVVCENCYWLYDNPNDYDDDGNYIGKDLDADDMLANEAHHDNQ